ncbi:MAG: SGNH/GDSL hydrolase family protein [Anaerolineae bacterium]|nr:SGNH/GDSL hydrolase family protein [Anaerolineae bacterium]
MRIVFLGDSLTAGTLGAGYVDRVAAALPHVTCINAGVTGDTTLNLLRRLPADVQPHVPDGVFVMTGINDAVSAAQGHGWPLYFREKKDVPGGQVSLGAFSRYFFDLLEALKGMARRVWAVLPPLESTHVVVETLRRYNAEAARIAGELGVPTLDLMAVLTPAHVPDRPPIFLPANLADQLDYEQGGRVYDMGQEGVYTYTFDGVHLTEAGAERVANEIVAFLRAQGV